MLRTGVKELFDGNRRVHWPKFKAQPILIKIRASPIRFVRAVIIPAARDFGFW